jgi:hypothetical protein
MAKTDHYRSALGNRLYFWLRDWNVPWAYNVRIVRGIKTLKSPIEYLHRKSIAHRVSGASQFAHKISEDEGYWLFRPEELSGAKAVAAECAVIFDTLQNSGRLNDISNNKKKHLRAIVNGDEFAAHPNIGRFALSPPVLEVAAGYFGSAPVLSTICLLWSVKTETAISSQRYHLDGEDVRQLKLFINVWDHDDANGPLTFLSAATSRDILRNADRTTRLNAGNSVFEDDFVTCGANGRPPIRVVGEAGGGVFLDTSRCIHYGSRRNTKERLMLMIQYTPYNQARESALDLGSADWLSVEPANELQRLAVPKYSAMLN